MKTIYVLGTIQNMTKMCVSQKIESISEKANFLEKILEDTKQATFGSKINICE